MSLSTSSPVGEYIVEVRHNIPPRFVYVLVCGRGNTYQGMYNYESIDTLRDIAAVEVGRGVAYLISRHGGQVFTLHAAPKRAQKRATTLAIVGRAETTYTLAPLRAPGTTGAVMLDTPLPSTTLYPRPIEYTFCLRMDNTRDNCCTYILDRIVEIGAIAPMVEDIRVPRVIVGQIVSLGHSLDGAQYYNTPVDSSGTCMAPFRAQYVRLYTTGGLQQCQHGLAFCAP